MSLGRLLSAMVVVWLTSTSCSLAQQPQPDRGQSTSVTVFVGAIAAIAGALAAGLANAYAANQRVKEVEISYLQRIKDGYLENARKVTGEVYIPPSIALTKLSNSYDRLSGWIDHEAQISGGPFREDFSTECLEYLAAVDDLMKRGADAYLTMALDEALQYFTNFVRDSMDARESRRKVALRMLVTTRPLRYFGVPHFEFKHEIAGDVVGKTLLPAFNVRLFGVEMGYVERVYAAKIESRDFEVQMRTGIPALKALIKEVTLGAPSLGSNAQQLHKS